MSAKRKEKPLARVAHDADSSTGQYAFDQESPYCQKRYSRIAKSVGRAVLRRSADKRRMDWLEKHNVTVRDGNWVYVLGTCANSDVSIRQRIDEEMNK